MRILKVIHGYPMRYNAGSEVYSQGLAQALAERHEVHVFTRVEDPFSADAAISEERVLMDSPIRKKMTVEQLATTVAVRASSEG